MPKPKYTAIPTKVAGIKYRSRLEARWAVFLKAHSGVKSFKYEPQTFETPYGPYTVDFRVVWEGETDEPFYIEIKPGAVHDEYFKKLRDIAGYIAPTELYIAVGNFYQNTQPQIELVSLQGKRYDPLRLSTFLPDSNQALVAVRNYRFDLK